MACPASTAEGRPGNTGFASRLRAARRLRRLSQNELGIRAGLQPAAISHFENGKRQPALANLRRLADALGTTTDYLCGRAAAPATCLPSPTLEAYGRLSAHDQELARDFVELLASRQPRKAAGTPTA